MSVSKWLKSTQRRVKETILQSVGAHDKTDDGIFDEKYQSFISFTRDLAKVHLSMQLWLDSIDLMCASTVGIGESLATFCTNSSQGEETPLLDVARAFHAIGSDFNTIVRTTMRSTFIDRCMKPIESILAVVPVINEKIQKRKNIRLDADFYRSKLSSEQSTGKADDHPVILKLSSKLKEATNSLNTITSELIDCIDELHSQREFMLGPEIAAMIACMQTFNSYSASHLSRLSPLMPQSASTSCLLLATFESQRKLASHENIDSLREKENFPMQPVFIRPSAQGGTAGGYGYTPLIDDTVSRVGSLLQSASSSVAATGGCAGDGAGAGVAAASGSGDAVSGSKKEARSSAPASLGSGVVSGKRPVIKLGSDTPTAGAGAGSAGTTPPRVASMAIPSKRASMSAQSESTPRPLSMPSSSPSHERDSSGSILENSFIPAPRSSGKRPISNRQHGKRTSINSLRLTASAAALSGSPKASLGIAAGQSLIENDAEADDDTEWKSWGDTGMPSLLIICMCMHHFSIRFVESKSCLIFVPVR